MKAISTNTVRGPLIKRTTAISTGYVNLELSTGAEHRVQPSVYGIDGIGRVSCFNNAWVGYCEAKLKALP